MNAAAFAAWSDARRRDVRAAAFATRTARALEAAGLTLATAAQLGDDELLMIPGVGVKMLAFIRAAEPSHVRVLAVELEGSGIEGVAPMLRAFRSVFGEGGDDGR